MHYSSKTYFVAEIGLFLWIWRSFEITAVSLMALSHSLKALTPLSKSTASFHWSTTKSSLSLKLSQGLVFWPECLRQQCCQMSWALEPPADETQFLLDGAFQSTSMGRSSFFWSLKQDDAPPLRGLCVKQRYFTALSFLFGNTRRKAVILMLKKVDLWLRQYKKQST